MNKIVTISIISFFAFVLVSMIEIKPQPITFTPETSVSVLLEKLGEDFSSKKAMKGKNISLESGKSIFHEGIGIKENGKKTKKQSKHFKCTSCHNFEKEDPDLQISDPQQRLDYTSKRNMPFLPGTTMYGVISRSSYYNDDYNKKYGDLVESARNDIRGAIQLCAVECAKGRSLQKWELESLLTYFWTLDIKIADLALSETEFAYLKNTENHNVAKIKLIKSKYLQASPAHFIPPPIDRKKALQQKGNIENGKLIYNNSCLHCHYQGKYSYLHLDNSTLSLRYLKRKAGTYHNHSVYQVTRWGVSSKSGKSSYMPQYPVEKMSESQLTDLVSYINFASN